MKVACLSLNMKFSDFILDLFLCLAVYGFAELIAVNRQRNLSCIAEYIEPSPCGSFILLFFVPLVFIFRPFRLKTLNRNLTVNMIAQI